MARSRDPLLVAAVLAATALPATTAQASEWALSPSVFVQLTLGRNWNAGIGTDFRSTFLNSCASCLVNNTTMGLGVFGQFVFQFRGDGLMVGAGIHGQRYSGLDYTNWEPKSLTAELGWAYRRGLRNGKSGHGALVGLSYYTRPWDLAARATLVHTDSGWLPEGHFLTGLREPGVSSLKELPTGIGRPQRDGDAFALGQVYLRSTQSDGKRIHLDTTRLAIGLDWMEAARAEAASVPAFLALACDLADAGAPVSLVGRALFAAVEELGHAKSSAAIAGAVLQCDVAVEVPPLVSAKETTQKALLERLAVDSWRDGLIGEAAAAQQAAIGARTARVPAIQRTLAAIAKEEATHAQLAADVVAWSIAVGGQAVAERVLAVANEDVAEPAPSLPEGVSVARWQAAGRVTAADAGAAHRQATQLARRSALQLVVG